MKTVREMIPEYKANLDRLRERRIELLEERKNEPSFERRHKLTERIALLEKIIDSTAAALREMMAYGE